MAFVARRPVLATAGAVAIAFTMLSLPPSMAVPATDLGASPTPPPQPVLPVDQLREQRLVNPRLGRTVGVMVLDAETGAVVYERDPDLGLRAASNMKLITAVTSLATMGPDGRFATSVLEGRRPGHVFLRGGGDPLLTRADLRALAAGTARSLGRSGPVDGLAATITGCWG